MLRYRERRFALKTLWRDQFARIHLEPAFTSQILGQCLSRLRARPTTNSAATAPLSSPSLTDRAGCAGPQNRYGILRLGRSQLGRPGTWSVWGRLRNDYERVYRAFLGTHPLSVATSRVVSVRARDAWGRGGAITRVLSALASGSESRTTFPMPRVLLSNRRWSRSFSPNGAATGTITAAAFAVVSVADASSLPP